MTQAADRSALTTELLTVVTALWFEIDHDDGSRASEFFTTDARLQFSTRIFYGTAEINSVYAQRSARGPRVSRHVVTNLHVAASDDTSASAISNLLLFAEDGEPPRSTVTPTMVADVADEFERNDQRWLIRSRRITPLFMARGATLAVPTR